MKNKDVKKFNASLKKSMEAGEMSKIDGTSSENLCTVTEAIEYLGVTHEELISCIENFGLNIWADKQFKEFLFDFEDLETLLNEFILPKRERESRATTDIEKTVTGGSYLDNWYNLEEAVEHLGISEDELICCMGKTDLEYLADDDFNYLFFYLEDLDILLKDIILPKRERERRATIDIEGVFTGDSFFDFWYTFEQAVMYLGITEVEFTNYLIKSDIEYLIVKDWMLLLFYFEDLETLRKRFVLPKQKSANG